MSLAGALAEVGWEIAPTVGRYDDPVDATEGVDLVVIATPDSAVLEVAGRIHPRGDVVVAHLAGSLGLDVLEPHPRRAALHPLVPLPSPEIGAERLRRGAWFAVAGDPMCRRVVEDLGGRSFTVDDEHRAAYHAAACIASNHLVALAGQVERIADSVGVPLEAYMDLVRATVENIAELGPRRALTGPAARGDLATIEHHRRALDPSELPAYDALVEAARRLHDSG